MPVKTPWHLWVVGIVSLLWNAMGALDYTMTEIGNPTYMGQFSAEELAYFNGFPAWSVAFWALGVWGALTGSVLLLLRKRWAVTAFGISVIGLIGTSLYQFTSDMPASLRTPGMMVFTAMIFVVTLGLLWYARRMRAHALLT